MIEVTACDLISGQVLTSQSSCQILQIPVTFNLFDESSLRYSLIISVSTAQLSSLFWVFWMCHWLQSTWNCNGYFPLWFSFVRAVCLPLTFLSFFCFSCPFMHHQQWRLWTLLCAAVCCSFPLSLQAKLRAGGGWQALCMWVPDLSFKASFKIQLMRQKYVETAYKTVLFSHNIKIMSQDVWAWGLDQIILVAFFLFWALSHLFS